MPDQREDAARMLIGYDGGDESVDALALGAVIARSLDAELVLAAGFPRIAPSGSPEQVEAALERESGRMFGTALERLPERDRARVANRRALGGQPSPDALRDLAGSEDADIVVVGSTRRGPLGRVVPGATATRLTHISPAPVAVAPRGYRDRAEERIDTVGVAFDGSEESRNALDAAAILAPPLGARIRVVGVVESVVDGVVPQPPADEAGPDPHLGRHALESALDDAIGSLPAGIEVDRVVLFGPPARALADLGEEAVDVMIVGSHGRGRILGMLLGSVSAKLSYAPPWPLLVVQPWAALSLGAPGRGAEGTGTASPSRGAEAGRDLIPGSENR